MFASAEVTGQGPPVLRVADAVLRADSLRRVSPAFGLVRRGDGGKDRDLVLPPGRPRSDDRTGGLRAQALVAGVGEQGDAGGRVSSSTRPT
jgi:hypothetical protein